MDDKALQNIVSAEVQRLADGAAVAASVSQGVVTLTGAVQSETRRILIEQELLALADVCDVRNHIRVAAPSGDPRTQLLSLLKRERLASPGVAVEHKDGVITLSGAVVSWFDRDAIERLAWSLPGIRKVINELALPSGVAGPEDDDGEVA